MATFSRLLILASAVLMFTACGQTSQEQAKSNADTAISDLKASATKMDNMGTPSETWSDAQLAEYDQVLSACDANADRVESLDGKDGVVIYGTWSLPRLRMIVSNNRSILIRVRAKKAEYVKDQARLDKLKVQQDEVLAFGAPDETWDQARLANFTAALDRLDATLDELTRTRGSDTKIQDKKSAVRKLRSIAESFKLTAKPAA